ncbi:MAG: Sua5/YciO/YrdC/YwlC family protein [Methylococcaceae bacterium]|nr:Sua5/YciO/YrdC/YwlC family protein [Methylococcaceae bacterium]
MNYYSNFKIRMAVHALKQGQIIAYPTEAVYGLGCDPLNESAAMHLLNIKQRPIHKGLILVASDFTQLQPFLKPTTSMLAQIMPSWPGPVTWVIPAQSWVPKYLKGEHDSLAVRVSAHPLVQQLCSIYGGAIVSTSANISNQAPARSSLAVRQNLNAQELFIIPGATPKYAQPTAIYNALDGSCLRVS